MKYTTNKLIVKNFYEYYLNENINSNITETDIREYLREEFDIAKTNIFVKLGNEFPLDNNKMDDANEEKIDNLINQLVEIYASIAISNISNFEKTWVSDDEKIIEGDTVEDKESGEIFFVSRLGDNNNFYDNNKHRFISLDNVKKINND